MSKILKSQEEGPSKETLVKLHFGKRFRNFFTGHASSFEHAVSKRYGAQATHVGNFTIELSMMPNEERSVSEEVSAYYADEKIEKLFSNNDNSLQVFQIY